MPDPWTPPRGLGIKEARIPLRAAISFTTTRTSITVSAIVMASVYRRSISCWLGASSCWLYSTGMPISSSMSTVSRRSAVASLLPINSK